MPELLAGSGLILPGTRHECACPYCDPTLAKPSGPKQGDHHYGVRFGTHERGKQVVFYLDGQEVRHVVEALAGPHGWIYAYQEDPTRQRSFHGCRRCYLRLRNAPTVQMRNRYGVCTVRLEGEVRIEERHVAPVREMPYGR